MISCRPPESSSRSSRRRPVRRRISAACPTRAPPRCATQGFLSLFAPRRLGGHQSSLEAATQVFAQLGRCCGASAWVAMLLSGGSFLASLLGDQVRREVWQDDPCTAVCGGFGMAQKARWAPGGLVVGGRWQPLTGVHQAQ